MAQRLNFFSLLQLRHQTNMVPLVPSATENNHFPQQGQYTFLINKITPCKRRTSDTTASEVRRGLSHEKISERSEEVSFYYVNIISQNGIFLNIWYGFVHNFFQNGRVNISTLFLCIDCTYSESCANTSGISSFLFLPAMV